MKWQVVDAVWERDLVVTSAAAANAVPVAEYTVAMIVLANKGVPLFAARERDPDARRAAEPSTSSNLGKKVGLVGASLVGRHVIELLRSYDLEVAVADPYLDQAEADRLGRRPAWSSTSCARGATCSACTPPRSTRPGG